MIHVVPVFQINLLQTFLWIPSRFRPLVHRLFQSTSHGAPISGNRRTCSPFDPSKFASLVGSTPRRNNYLKYKNTCIISGWGSVLLQNINGKIFILLLCYNYLLIFICYYFYFILFLCRGNSVFLFRFLVRRFRSYFLNITQLKLQVKAQMRLRHSARMLSWSFLPKYYSPNTKNLTFKCDNIQENQVGRSGEHFWYTNGCDKRSHFSDRGNSFGFQLGTSRISAGIAAIQHTERCRWSENESNHNCVC